MSQGFVQAKPSVGAASQGHGPFQGAIAETSAARGRPLGPAGESDGESNGESDGGGDRDGDTEDTSGLHASGRACRRERADAQTRPTRETRQTTRTRQASKSVGRTAEPLAVTGPQ